MALIGLFCTGVVVKLGLDWWSAAAKPVSSSREFDN
jgi:hypothetical protein